jgi:hypothetical protein
MEKIKNHSWSHSLNAAAMPLPGSNTGRARAEAKENKAVLNPLAFIYLLIYEATIPVS